MYFTAVLFTSFEFLVFFPLVAAVFFLAPQRLQWSVILVASYVFYMYQRPVYGLLLITATVTGHLAATRIHASTERGTRLRWLCAAITVNMCMLLWFKFGGLFTQHPGPLSGWEVVLPIGISFYTFQTIAYTTDVFRGKVAPEPHFGRFASFIAFFPQLLSGPVERATNLLPQFRTAKHFDQQRIIEGLKRVSWGFFKKLVVADRIAPIVDHVYADPSMHDAPTVLLAAVLYSVQLYFDFSGYCDIAIGAARVLGFKLMENFRSPQLATSVTDFWKRWHISMSTWFRDYVYIPMGGNRVHTERWYFNIMVVFFLSGIWHGAGWNFICYGLVNGLFMVSALMTRGWWHAFNIRTGLHNMPRLHRALMITGTFALVTFSRIFFRADDMDQALGILEQLVRPGLGAEGLLALASTFKPVILGTTLAIAAVGLFLDHRIEPVVLGVQRVGGRAGQYVVHAGLLALLVLLGNFGERSFIYFRF